MPALRRRRTASQRNADNWNYCRTQDAIAVIRRCATAYLVRIKKERVFNAIQYYLWFKDQQPHVNVPKPNELQWALKVTLRRYLRTVTARLKYQYIADLSRRIVRSSSSAETREKIEALMDLSEIATDLERELRDYTVPNDVASVRGLLMFVPAYW